MLTRGQRFHQLKFYKPPHVPITAISAQDKAQPPPGYSSSATTTTTFAATAFAIYRAAQRCCSSSAHMWIDDFNHSIKAASNHRAFEIVDTPQALQPHQHSGQTCECVQHPTTSACIFSRDARSFGVRSCKPRSQPRNANSG